MPPTSSNIRSWSRSAFCASPTWSVARMSSPAPTAASAAGSTVSSSGLSSRHYRKARAWRPAGSGDARERIERGKKSRIHRRGTEFAEFGALLDRILFSAYSASRRCNVQILPLSKILLGRNVRRKPKAIPHGSGYFSHHKRGESPCPSSREGFISLLGGQLQQPALDDRQRCRALSQAWPRRGSRLHGLVGIDRSVDAFRRGSGGRRGGAGGDLQRCERRRRRHRR